MASVLFVLKAGLGLKKYEQLIRDEFAGTDLSLDFTTVKGGTRKLEPDLVVSIGGDGTFLSTARMTLSLPNIPPILGVNIGTLGFLTLFSLDTLKKAVDDYFNSKAIIEERAVLEVKYGSSSLLALNDIVVNRTGVARVIDYEMYINQEFVSSIKADGLIVSTPTGSTAYSLAAGGPILESSLSAIILTPISPHTLANRPLVINDNKKIKILVNSDTKDVIITADGQEYIELSMDNEIFIFKHSRKIRLLKPSNKSYFEVLREKMHLGVRG